MDADSVAAEIADVAQQLERLAVEVQQLKALYADAPRRGALRTRAWREAYERTRVKRNHRCTPMGTNLSLLTSAATETGND